MDSEEKREEMAPKTPEKDAKPKVETSGNILESINDDLDEIDLVSDSLDSLNSALDAIEQRANNMRTMLIELQMSNRELLKELREDNKTTEPESSPEEGSKSGGNS
ncbi:UPF0184 protein AAEL002161-like [Phlebotomus argentipes]|uniref:UPF0184 protein AAEL002161-like n=1 Tax=Phlebotomus argentipes TaxID=94469 RepID=UPI002892F827|nr:UPF0184 protein AAEL002161-like [Phlebotomus argentipes]